MQTIVNDPSKRHDFIFLTEVADGNPNGDPDAGNLPRIDPETMQGIITDVALKRKIRNTVDLFKGDQDRYKIYIQNKGVALNAMHRKAYEAEGLTSGGTKQAREDIDKVRAWMCNNYFDIRTFGAVMTTEVNAGQVRGPMQLTFSRSIDPIVPQEVAITRVAVTREQDVEIVESETQEGKTEGKVSEMGRKAIVRYALYRGFGYFNPYLAEQTGFDSDDLALFWEALQNMFELDRSASRGSMELRGLYVFSHDRKSGNAHAHELFESIEVKLKEEAPVPRSFKDYEVIVPEDSLPDGVTLTRLVG